MTTRYIKLVGTKEFATAVLDSEYKIFLVHIPSLNSSVMSLNSILLDADVHPFVRPQITGLIAEKTFTKVFDKYVDFTDVFFVDLASKLSEPTGINDHTIELVDS